MLATTQRMIPACFDTEVATIPVPDPVHRLLSLLSSLDADQIAGLLSEDARLHTSQGVVAVGRSRIRKELMRAISPLISIHCVPAVVWAKDNVSVIEADLRCERMDGSRVAFPVTLILCLRNLLICDIRLFTYEPSVISNFLMI